MKTQLGIVGESCHQPLGVEGTPGSPTSPAVRAMYPVIPVELYRICPQVHGNARLRHDYMDNYQAMMTAKTTRSSVHTQKVVALLHHPSRPHTMQTTYTNSHAITHPLTPTPTGRTRNTHIHGHNQARPLAFTAPAHNTLTHRHTGSLPPSPRCDAAAVIAVPQTAPPRTAVPHPPAPRPSTARRSRRRRT